MKQQFRIVPYVHMFCLQFQTHLKKLFGVYLIFILCLQFQAHLNKSRHWQ